MFEYYFLFSGFLFFVSLFYYKKFDFNKNKDKANDTIILPYPVPSQFYEQLPDDLCEFNLGITNSFRKSKSIAYKSRKPMISKIKKKALTNKQI